MAAHKDIATATPASRFSATAPVHHLLSHCPHMDTHIVGQVSQFGFFNWVTHREDGISEAYSGFTRHSKGCPWGLPAAPQTPQVWDSGHHLKAKASTEPFAQSLCGSLWPALCCCTSSAPLSPGGTFALWPCTDHQDPPGNPTGAGALRAGLLPPPGPSSSGPHNRTPFRCLKGRAGIRVGQSQGSRPSEPGLGGSLPVLFHSSAEEECLTGPF